MKSILIINKDPQINRILKSSLEKDGYTVIVASNGEDGLRHVQKNPSVIIIDTSLPDSHGLALLKVLKERSPHSTCIALLSANVSKEEACNAGAHEYLEKPFTLFALNLILEDTLRTVKERIEKKGENYYIQSLLKSPFTLGTSAPMVEVQNRIKSLIHTHTPLLITGEKGTGKEEIGKIIHQARCGDSDSFVSVNLALLPWPLQKPHIFSHLPSARHKGAFYQAHGGILFIGSLERLTKEMQKILLQKLRDQKKEIQAETYIISSTTIDIDELVKKGEFNIELLELMGSERLVIPPLRMRGEDIKAAAIYFLDEIKNTTQEGTSSLSPEVERYLLSHNWPHNIKELKRTIIRACVAAKGERITMDDIHPQRPNSIEEFLENKLNSYMHNIKKIENFNLYVTVISEVERALILIALKETQGNQLKASKLLGINRNTIKKKIDQLHIDVNEFKALSDTHSSS